MTFSLGMKTLGLQGLIASMRSVDGRIGDQMHDDLNKAGDLLIGEVPKHIIGKRATNPPEVLGVVTGRLRQSIGKILQRVGRGWKLIVGPQRVKYGAVHELGPHKRPYLAPSLGAKREEIVEILGDGLVAAVRAG